MVVLVGDVGEVLLAELGRSGNVSVARAPAAGPPGGAEPVQARPAWQVGAQAMREAAGRQSAYVIVPDDPLADVAAAWRAMWDVASGPGAAVSFEEHAAEALAAWRDKRFELPDYYLVVAAVQAEGIGPDLYLGPLRAARPRRVAAVLTAADDGQAAGQVRQALRELPHGPWWPPLDELLGSARTFFAGSLGGSGVATAGGAAPR